MSGDIWNGEVGEAWHKHDFDGPYIKGESCDQCPKPDGALIVSEVNIEDRTITIKTASDRVNRKHKKTLGNLKD